MLDSKEIKEKILSSFRRRGPSLPVHIAKEVNLSILFASAFLSELVSEKRIRMSNMKIGSSPLYLIPGQENRLENFIEFIKGKEKEALLKIKNEKFLQDSEQEPAIRVALRAIKDFAIPFKNEDKIFWRYFTIPQNEFKTELEKQPIKEEIQKPETNETKKEEIRSAEKEEPKKELEKIFEEKQEIKIKEKRKKSKPSKKQEEKFLERVREFLSRSSTEIISIEGIKKGELILKIRREDKEQLLIAFNKRKISEKDLINASKKAKEIGLKYSVISLGDLPKRFSDLLEAIKGLEEISKFN